MAVQKRKVGGATPQSTHRSAPKADDRSRPRSWPCPSAKTAFLLLAAARLLSAALNIVHDCDEVFNYWEPLHYLLYGSGMQTWEYSSAFALRSYLYLLLHGAVAAPAALLLGAGRGKLVAFYLVKGALGLASAGTEALLYRAVRRRYSPALASQFLLLVGLSSGLFVSSTAFLPSSFAMVALTGAAAAVVEGQPYWAIAASAIGMVWGWIVAGVAFLPYALWVLAVAPLGGAIACAAAWLVVTMGPLVLVDRAAYGRWTASLWNFVLYNVVGGGESHLYGVEGPGYYLRNGFNNLQAALPLALLFPLALALAAGDILPDAGGKKVAAAAKRSAVASLVTVLSPAYLWLAAIGRLPHKEERFLYVVYPLLCLAAAASLTMLTALARRVGARVLGSRAAGALAQTAAVAVVALTVGLSAARSAAMVAHYGAPMRILTHLPPLSGGPGSAPVYVCAGAEWHRFPSSFFLPGPRYRLQFIKSGFNGLLPRPFDSREGGTAAAPATMNERNREEEAHRWPSAARCDYAVTLRDAGQVVDELGPGPWETVASLPFVDHARSPPLFRAFHVPVLSWRRNKVVEYVLLRQRR